MAMHHAAEDRKPPDHTPRNMKLHDKILLASNLLSAILLLSLCWYQALLVLMAAVVYQILNVPEMICMCLDVYYKAVVSQAIAAKVVVCTEYQDDGLQQQFLVEYDEDASQQRHPQQLSASSSGEEEDDDGGNDDEDATAATASYPKNTHQSTTREIIREGVVVSNDAAGNISSRAGVKRKWIFNPPSFKDHEHPHRARWPRLQVGDSVDVMVLPSTRGCHSSGCRMRDPRLDSCLDSFGLALGFCLFGGIFIFILGMCVAMLAGRFCFDDDEVQWCCAPTTKMCVAATVMLCVINTHLWHCRTYEQDRTRALALLVDGGESGTII